MLITSTLHFVLVQNHAALTIVTFFTNRESLIIRPLYSSALSCRSETQTTTQARLSSMFVQAISSDPACVDVCTAFRHDNACSGSLLYNMRNFLKVMSRHRRFGTTHRNRSFGLVRLGHHKKSGSKVFQADAGHFRAVIREIDYQLKYECVKYCERFFRAGITASVPDKW